MANTPNAEELVRWYNQLKSQRSNFDQINQEIIDYIVPHNSDITSEIQPGQKKTSKIFDSTATYGSFVLSQFIMGSVLNQASKWFSLAHSNKTVNEKQEVAAWLKNTSENMLGMFRRTNFYLAGGQAIGSWVNFGTGAVLIEGVPQSRDGLRPIRYTSVPFGQYVLAEGPDGKVDTFIRSVKMKARNACKMFDRGNGGMGVSDELTKLAEKEPFKDVEILHAIYPRDIYGKKGKLQSAKQMPYASCWMEKEKKKLVKESGYRKFPVAIARYDLLSGETYARGPAHLALPDAKSLNQADEMELLAWSRELDSPLLIKRNSVISDKISLRAGGQTIVSDMNGIKPLFDKTNWNVDNLNRTRKEQAILRIFHVQEILQLLSNDKPSGTTAFEVNTRLALLQQILGPVFGRLEMDFLSVIIDVTMDIMAYIPGAFETPPDDVLAAGEKNAFDAVYEGPLARSQRNAEILNIQQSVADVGGLAQFDPEIAHMVDWKKAARKLFDIRGTQDLMLSEEDFAQKMKEIMEQQQAQAQMQAMIGTADSLGKAAPFLQVMRDSASGSTPSAIPS